MSFNNKLEKLRIFSRIDCDVIISLKIMTRSNLSLCSSSDSSLYKES